MPCVAEVSLQLQLRLDLTWLGLRILILIHRLWPWGIVGGQRRRRSQIINKLDFSSKSQVDVGGEEREIEEEAAGVKDATRDGAHHIHFICLHVSLSFRCFWRRLLWPVISQLREQLPLVSFPSPSLTLCLSSSLSHSFYGCRRRRRW